MEQNVQDQLTEVELEFDDPIRHDFANAAKWAKFISVIMFICGGLLLLLAIGSLKYVSELTRLLNVTYQYGIDSGLIMTILIVAALVMAGTFYFLLNFSIKIRNALLSENIETINEGINSLKTFFLVSSIINALSLAVNIYNLVK